MWLVQRQAKVAEQLIRLAGDMLHAVDYALTIIMAIGIVRAGVKRTIDAQTLLNEYYEALEIQKRDTPEATARLLEESNTAESKTGFWLAYEGTEPVGCIALRLLNAEELGLAGFSSNEAVGEVKRLFVRPGHRGKQIADALVDAVELFAVTQGMQWLYLDTKDDLYAAIKLYKRRGYEECPRYNTNPQATLFLRHYLLDIQSV